jgi:hypothetical protein
MKRFSLILFTAIYTHISLAQSYGDYAVRVEVAGNGFGHFTTVYFDDESWDPQNPPTYGWDPCCDAQMIWANTNQPHVFTQVVAPPLPTNNYRLSINGLPHVFEHIGVPLGFLPGALAQYNFTFKELYTLPIGMGVELEDHAQNVIQDLLQDSTYSTWGAVSDDEERFTLHFYPENITSATELDKDVGLNVFYNLDHVVVSGLFDAGMEEVKVYDMYGRLFLSDRVIKGTNEFSLDRANMASGVYLLRFTGSEWNEKTVKVYL